MKKNNQHKISDHQDMDEIECAIWCDVLEEQYQKAKENGVFEILKVLEFDTKHTEQRLVQAVNYFNEKDGNVEADAPMEFLTVLEKNHIYQNGNFRPKLYCMILSTKFSEAIGNQSAFIQNSLKYSFDNK